MKCPVINLSHIAIYMYIVCYTLSSCDVTEGLKLNNRTCSHSYFLREHVLIIHLKANVWLIMFENDLPVYCFGVLSRVHTNGCDNRNVPH